MIPPATGETHHLWQCNHSNHRRLIKASRNRRRVCTAVMLFRTIVRTKSVVFLFFQAMKWVGKTRHRLSQARLKKGQTSLRRTRETSARQNRASSVNSTGDNLILQLCLNQRIQSAMTVTTVMLLSPAAMEAQDLEQSSKEGKRSVNHTQALTMSRGAMK